MGASGSGKTWLAVRIAAKLDLAHLELDSLRHQADGESYLTPTS